ncbi:50S ribosomal protein L16 3-hydroxylase [Zhongshania aliphaticivorans]|uniref:50S ribosomal protein L16 3-hydroxylase n=1 Tax=Zhongshania aliphaticivorans TaxID=1470434 RepID=A0A5S9NEE4_9GAMM|nr:cupin domain-containing protein [Zhongshania aliphaticivorans]CAA0088757.1 50S ribosomal protein L16 3-hydroxylase [Zhongshania aliphaticivorans]CAA0095081.1 50S ribosomal protein L16 3-hydroxylase [Zhongshania aliphaticivorans]
MALQHFDAQWFLDHIWQRKALLLKDAIPNFECPLDGNDLAGLACEDDIDSRIIIEKDGAWELRDGPFDEAIFATLPASKWTLLVQSVDHFLPELSDLFAHFRFIPRWRAEDIMVSYACDGGNVGPHYDQYDVFLVQGSGRRRWKIGGHCTEDTPLNTLAGLRLLKEFNAEQEYVLEAGDVLYVPPGVAHWGIAEGDDCITLSVGFRAPSEASLISDYSDDIASLLDESIRYQDPRLEAKAHPAEIPVEVCQHVKSLLLQHLDDETHIARWFGEMMTRVPDQENFIDHSLSPENFLIELAEGAVLQIRLGARLAFDDNYLYADGLAFPYPPEQKDDVKALCEFECGVAIDTAHRLSPDMIYALFCNGTLCFYDDTQS